MRWLMPALLSRRTWAFATPSNRLTQNTAGAMAKGEALAALMQALFLAGAGLVLVVESMRRLLRPEPLEAIAFGLWIIGAS